MIILQKYWKPILWAILIFIGSAVSGNKLNKIPVKFFPHFDKIVHFGLYFLFMIFLVNSMNDNTIRKKTVYISLIISALYGVIMEVLQKYVFIKRSLDIYDFTANMVGIIIAMMFYLFAEKYLFFLRRL